MIYDFQNMFDQAAVITVTRNSTNSIDLKRATQDLGAGEALKISVTVITTFTAGGAATLHIALITSDSTGLTSPVLLQDQAVVIPVASLVAGFELPFYIHPTAAMLQYLALLYTVATGPMTAGDVTAGVVKDTPRWKAHPRNYATA
jgi:hypothetical protein